MIFLRANHYVFEQSRFKSLRYFKHLGWSSCTESDEVGLA